MTTTTREDYEAWSSSQYCPVYLLPWYLDVVCGRGHWQAHLQVVADTVVAIWICNTRKKGRLTYSVTPELSPYHGLHIVGDHLAAADLEQFANYVRAHYHYMEHDLAPQDWLSAADEKTTFIINQSHSSDAAWGMMKSDYRRKIKKAKAEHTVVEVEFDHFREILTQSFSAKEKKQPYNMALFSKLDAECKKHNTRRILGLTDQQGKIVAAAYFLHDQQCTYYLAGGHVAGTNPMYLLLWEGIKQSLDRGRAFDFEGSMIPGVAQFFRGFGGQQTAYAHYTHSRARWVNWLVNIKKKLS